MSISDFLFSDPMLSSIKHNMDIQIRRSELIAGNLANIETPGYKAVDIDFESALKSASSRQSGGSSKMWVTDSRHIQGVSGGDLPITQVSDDESHRVDGNTVDLDKEMSKLVKTQLMYEAGINALVRKMSLLSKAADASGI